LSLRRWNKMSLSTSVMTALTATTNEFGFGALGSSKYSTRGGIVYAEAALRGYAGDDLAHTASKA